MYANMVETVQKSKESEGEGCILAHCMGLGKTIQTLAIVQALLCSKDLDWCRRVLVSFTLVFRVLFLNFQVLCPMNTLHNWLRELSEWLDHLERPELRTYSLNEGECGLMI